MHGHLSAHTVCKLLIYKSAVLLRFTSLPNDLSPEGPAAVGVAHRIRRAVLATAAGHVGKECSITCTSSVQLVTLVTSFNASDFSH